MNSCFDSIYKREKKFIIVEYGSDSLLVDPISKTRKFLGEISGITYIDPYETLISRNENAKDDIQDLSDGYNTFHELYEHKMILFACLCSINGRAWKSKLHHDGTMDTDFFIVGINTDFGQISYHYHIDCWDKFKCKELEFAPEHDGSLDENTLDKLIKTYIGYGEKP